MPTYVVTGASSGIGLEIVTQLAARGEKVFATVRKRGSSMSGVDAISEVKGDITVVEGIDVTDDNVGDVLAASALAGVTIDVLIHNAGSFNGTRDVAAEDLMKDQDMDVITMKRMREAFEVNTLGPLRVQKALNAQMASPGGKVGIISTGIGSIADNTSGGKYAYRTSKAGVNMVARSLAMDLKGKGISVTAIAPGFVVSEFGAGAEKMKAWGAKPVDQAGKGIIQVLDTQSLDTTGKFWMVPSSGEDPKEFPW